MMFTIYSQDILSKQDCEIYGEDILDHMKRMEDKTLPDVPSIEAQQEIKWFMRPYLIDFLTEAHAAFHLLPETLFLAVNLLDRYCSRRVVYKRHYQLVGCAALLIAAKYGDKKEYVPLIRELKSMCCSLYEEEMFTQMEGHVLNTLGWVIGHPTVDTWLQLALYDAPFDFEVKYMTLYLTEIAMYEKDFVGTKPSVMAHAALVLARSILRRSEVKETHNLIENMTLRQFSQQLSCPSKILQNKYASPHRARVSVTFKDFLDQQEAASRRAIPQNPPHNAVASGKIEPAPEMFPSTPQKPYGNMVNGYMTPPITPEGEYFDNGDELITRFPLSCDPYVLSEDQHRIVIN